MYVLECSGSTELWLVLSEVFFRLVLLGSTRTDQMNPDDSWPMQSRDHMGASHKNGTASSLSRLDSHAVVEILSARLDSFATKPDTKRFWHDTKLRVAFRRNYSAVKAAMASARVAGSGQSRSRCVTSRTSLQ